MDWSITTVYLGCAALGGTVLVLQSLLLLFGGGDHDVDHDVDAGPHDSGEHHDAGLGLISIRSIASFLCFFGLVGWGGTSAGWSTFPTLAAATGAGLLMLVAVAWLFSLQRKLHASGTIDPANAVGQIAHVYLRIPGANEGKGKITLSLQGRSAEFAAFTRGPAIATGSEVRILHHVTADTFEVEAVGQETSPR